MIAEVARDELDFAEVGGSDYMYIAQKDGRVRLAIDGVLQSGVVVDYRDAVNGVRDRGLDVEVLHPATFLAAQLTS